ncbi:STAS domain-containing protein [Streptomyces sp. ISL-22]|uniref:STAS domain-containing protein n=1 Tax=unclassified Streptomyces TaxID=2593676 RepID=UPI001BE7ACEE|nr:MULTISPECIES: STAS domain-containing protein [unclassified Streptomyces]MBT2423502.1 STAS domain-containing protein [Streptomyces sp. ISL-24]MBT2432505.1 STAS domain-containing protein [Streptomyces sp. ISL-22]
MADPSVDMTTVGRCLVARVSGDMDYLTDPVFRARFKELVVRGERFIVLDLSGVSFCDSAGLNVLLGARRQADDVGAVLVLACVPDLLRRVLEMTGADRVLRVFDTVTDAEAVFGR